MRFSNKPHEEILVLIVRLRELGEIRSRMTGVRDKTDSSSDDEIDKINVKEITHLAYLDTKLVDSELFIGPKRLPFSAGVGVH